ncbi:MAG: hypothetical protein U5L04_12455 [Trueperaceae bacterium]|nr:hypothetical protein [Trueperaceae bacterium]
MAVAKLPGGSSPIVVTVTVGEGAYLECEDGGGSSPTPTRRSVRTTGFALQRPHSDSTRPDRPGASDDVAIKAAAALD